MSTDNLTAVRTRVGRQIYYMIYDRLAPVPPVHMVVGTYYSIFKYGDQSTLSLPFTQHCATIMLFTVVN